MTNIKTIADAFNKGGATPRQVAQLTGLNEQAAREAVKHEKLCHRAPVYGAMFSDTPTATTPFETLLRTQTSGFGSSDALEKTIKGLRDCYAFANSVGDRQASAAVMMRACALRERAIASGKNDAAKAIGAWHAATLLADIGLNGDGSTDREVALRAEFEAVTKQRDTARGALDDRTAGNYIRDKAHLSPTGRR